MGMSDISKYFNDDTVFNAINKQFVSLQQKDIKECNVHVQKVVNELVKRISNADTFFKTVYQRILFGGSFYKGTKVGFPEEFDLNIVIKLPINYNLIKVELCQPGFVKIYSGLKPNELTDDQKIHRELKKLLDQNMYLDQDKFRRWMESILTKTVAKLPGQDGCRLLYTDSKQYKISIRKTGPAFTLYIEILDNKIICIDLVPVLELTQEVPNIRCNLRYFQKKNWFAVPKPLGDKGTHLYWRTSFYEQEKEILSKNGKIKPVFRQIKKLRDTQHWKHLASYYIETLLLHVLEKNINLETKSCTSLFMMMLENLHIALKNKCIPYYWDTNYNLLSGLKYEEMSNIEGRMRNIILKINRCIQNDPFVIASCILNAEELLILKYLQNEESLEDPQNKETLEDPQNRKSVESQQSSNNWNCAIL